MTNITKSIIDRIIAKQQGWVFSPKDFLDLGSRAAIDKVISRLTQKALLERFPEEYMIILKSILISELFPLISMI